MDFELSITICSWNTCADTMLCLEKLYEVRNEAQFEVIVFDNGSTDGTPQAIKERFPLSQNLWLKLIESPVNRGFTGGHNECLRLRRAPDALLLNSDAFVHPSAIKTLIDFAQTHPESGIIGPKLLNPDGSLQLSCRRFPNPIAALYRSTFIGKLFPHNRFARDYLMSDWDHGSVRDVDWISGAAFYVKKTVIDKVGVFDDLYFMYCEDVDWCYRAGKAGFKITYVPTAIVTHKIGSSSSQVANKMIVRFHRSMLRFYRKNMISELPKIVRPFAVVFAAGALFSRATLFILKNDIDFIWRLLGKSNDNKRNSKGARSIN